MKALVLQSDKSTCAAILEDRKGLVYTNFYNHHLDKFDCKQAESTDIMKEMDKFNSYWGI